MIIEWWRTRLRHWPWLRRAWNDWTTLNGMMLKGGADWYHWRTRKHKPRTRSSSRTSVVTSRRLKIAFVTNKVFAREIKLAYAARLRGHHITLLAPNVELDENTSQYFDERLRAQNPWQALARLSELEPDVTHLIVQGDNLFMLPVLLYAPSPVVYDPYDCWQGMLQPNSQASALELAAERLCFANADYVCSRSLEPRYLRRHQGYAMPATLYFPEYCWREPRQREPRVISDEQELHLVYCGGIWPEDRYPAATAGYAQYLDIGRALGQQRIHLHLYPAKVPSGTTYESFYSLYLQEDQHNPFFHMHPTLPYMALMQELTRYDAALHIFGMNISYTLGSATLLKRDLSSANKLFDYIEAGLPVIIHIGRHQRGIVRHYGISIEISDISQIRAALLSALVKQPSRKSEATIAHHAQRLDQMYRFWG